MYILLIKIKTKDIKMANQKVQRNQAEEKFDPRLIAECGDCTCFNLRKTSRVITQMFEDAMRPIELRGTQFPLLAHAFGNSPITITRLAEMMVTDRTTLARNLAPLEKRGLIKIQAGEDRRQRIVELTEQGREKLYEAYPIWKDTQEKIKKKLGTEKWSSLMANMSELVESVKES